MLNVHTGQTQMLPDDLSRYDWAVVGTEYAESPNTGCGGYDECFALYDLATGAISVHRAPAIVDLDRPGAPLCPALRRRILAAQGLRSHRRSPMKTVCSCIPPNVRAMSKSIAASGHRSCSPAGENHAIST